MSIEGIVLAGGLGTRLRDAVPDLPKPMAPVAGRPFLSWLLDYLDGAGFDHIVLSIGYRGEAITKYFGFRYGNINLDYAVEVSPLGTGGATLKAMTKCHGNPFFVINGDTFLAINYGAMLASHFSSENAFTMAVRHVEDVSRYGRVVLKDGKPNCLQEKSATGAGLVNSGVYLFDRKFFEGSPMNVPCSLERDIIGPQLARTDAGVFPTTAYFIDIGIPDDYLRAQTELLGH